MGAAATARAPKSPRQAATWERKDEYFIERDERDATARECKHCDSLAAERRKRGAGRRRVELGLPAGLFSPRALVFVEVLAGVLRFTKHVGLVGPYSSVASLIEAFGVECSYNSARNAIAELVLAQWVIRKGLWCHHPEGFHCRDGTTSKTPEGGSYYVPGPMLELALKHLGAARRHRRKNQGCQNLETSPDLLPSAEAKNTERACAIAGPQSHNRYSARRQNPEGKVSPPTASTQITNKAPSAPTEKAASREGAGASSATAAKPIAVAPTRPVAASEAPGGGPPTPPQPSSPWARVWVAKEVEQQLADHCRTHKRKRADLVAEALAAYTGGEIASPAAPPRLRLVPSVSVSPPAAAPAAPVERASEAFARLSLDLLRARFTGRITLAELGAFTARVEAGEVDQVAAELAARAGEPAAPIAVSNPTFPTVAPKIDAIGAPTSDVAGVGGYSGAPSPAPERVPAGARGSSYAAATPPTIFPPAEAPPAPSGCDPLDVDATAAAEACRAWLRDYQAEQAERAAPPAPANGRPARWSPTPDFDVLGAELALGDWYPSRMGALLDGALASLRAKVRE